MPRAQSTVYRSTPDDAAPTRYSARPKPSSYRSPPPRPPASQAPPAKAPSAAAEAAREKKRIAKLQHIRTEILHNATREAVESVLLIVGDDELLAMAREVLAVRDPALPEERGKKRERRRCTMYITEAVGAALNAKAKADKIDRAILADRLLAEALGVPLEA